MKNRHFTEIWFLLFGAAFIMSVLPSFKSSNTDDDSGGTTKPDTTTTKPSTNDKATYDITETPNPYTWVAVDGQGNTIDPESSTYPDVAKRSGKYCGIFYFLWHGCHGYDTPTNGNEPVAPTAADTQSPYNIPDLLAANPSSPKWGMQTAMHHWGEPYLGYYVAGDEWVIRKHAQMLSDAGIDVLFFDVTNGYDYLPVVKKMAQVYAQMRAEGNTTPQFAFLTNVNTSSIVTHIYNEIYAQGLYSDLWFQWLGKPLILANPDEVPASIKSYFTIRRSWYLWNNSGADTWFGDGVDKWPWGGLYPQQAGTHGGKNECVSVMPATHPVSNIGRSYNATSDYEPSNIQSGKGIYFKSQFTKAKSLNPAMLFFTGWNEWVAQRLVAANDGEAGFLGHSVSKGETYFVDTYNHEFSRDIEPLNGDFGDNYYYLLVDYIRQFKGTKNLPVFNTTNTMAVDGDMSDWSGVKALYGDDKGDIVNHSHYGWGRVGTLTNTTGRNDIVLSKVATDGTNIYFYVKTSSNITPYTDANWMRLFISIKGSTDSSWEGFNYVVNNSVSSETETTLQKCTGGWKWTEASKLKYKVNKNEMELAIPLSSLGITTPNAFTIDFKWVDNAVADGNIQTCMRDGDSAPNGRFRYRFIFKK